MIVSCGLNLHSLWTVRAYRVLILFVLCLLLQACTTPADKLNLLAVEQGFSRSKIRAEGYDLLVYDNRKDAILQPERPLAASTTLNIYLEGDGSPWRYRTVVMPDPTPRSPLMLRLMALDPGQASYLGRPCYNGSSQDPGCDSRMWTSGRYSTRVIASMASAAQHLIRQYQAREVRLIGHSGGGALAMLLAAELPDVTEVVTIAGNLDTDAWTRYHGYTPLYSSLNPARQPPLKQSIWQWHIMGSRDAVIPPLLVRPFVMAQEQAEGFILPGFDHACCWYAIWPSVLAALTNKNPSLMPGRRFKNATRSVIAEGNP